MGWSDDRVKILTKLWLQGFSAAQIAVELGGGVTRNAVIGKVHRLKLSGRVKPANSAARARVKNKTPRRPSASTSSSTSVRARQKTFNAAPSIGATALKADENIDSELQLNKAQIHELFIPVEERVSLLELNEDVCKWPIGDPLHSEFHFCGKHSLDKKPYCEFHAKRAYHNTDKKRR